MIRRPPLSVVIADAAASVALLRTDSVSVFTSSPKKLSTSARLASSWPAVWPATTMPSSVGSSTTPSCACPIVA